MQSTLLSPEKRKDGIGKAFLSAIAANAGYVIQEIDQSNDYGVDFEIRRLVRRGSEIRDNGPIADIQLKTTCNWDDSDPDSIIYDLEAKNYNDMTDRNAEGLPPIILAVLCLEKDAQSWVTVGEIGILLRNTMYWYITDETQNTQNSATTRIRIPKENLLTSSALDQLIKDMEA